MTIYSIYGASVNGLRTVNQDVIGINADSILDLTADRITYSKELTANARTLQVFAVADGVGGSQHGEIASGIAVRTLNKWFDEHKDDEDICPCMIYDLFNDLNEQVVSENMKLGVKAATTLTLLILIDGKFILCNIGDTPAYLIRRHKMFPLYEKQTLGNLIRKETGHEPDPGNENVLMSYLGNKDAKPSDEVHIITGEIKDHDVFLVSSDGLINAMPKWKITQLMSAGDFGLRRTLKKLKKKQKDNCTFIKVEVRLDRK